MPKEVSQQSSPTAQTQQDIITYKRRKSREGSTMEQLVESGTGTCGPDKESELPIAKRKGVRSCTQHPSSNHISYSHLSDSYRAFTSCISKHTVPSSFHEAAGDPRWRAAMDEEMSALYNNNMWELVDPPSDKNLVGSKWVYTLKYNADGEVVRYKARLVAQGFTQAYGIDYT